MHSQNHRDENFSKVRIFSILFFDGVFEVVLPPSNTKVEYVWCSHHHHPGKTKI